MNTIAHPMFDNRDIEGDANRILDVVANGGVAIFPATVGYAIVGHTEDAVKRIYAAKQRSFGKPCGWFGSWELFNDFIEIDAKARSVVSSITQKHGLPFSIVAPFNAVHPFVKAVPQFVRQSATLKGTMDMLLNAGELHDAIANGARQRGLPVVGSSANQSLTGSKYRLEDVEEVVREAADLCIDYGHTTYHNSQGMGSTIVDLRDYKTLRVGCTYDEICKVLLDEFDLNLNEIGTAPIPK
jgi:tRNA A37 threonylcarbamoyladenosine synthetase subunit TsaC/SUA5/YrdC